MNESLMNRGSILLPQGASTVTHLIDFMYYAIFILTVVFFIFLMLGMGYLTLRYLRTKNNPKPTKQITHNTPLELFWTIIPLFLVMIIFWVGFRDYLVLSVAPKNTLDVHVKGRKWAWSFEHVKSGVKTGTDLVVPVNRAVRLIMTSDDVLHSFYIPNMRVKRDVIPNRYTTVWFEAIRTGRFQIFCTEFCGDKHSEMLANLIVLSRSEYDSWTKKQQLLATADLPLPQLAERAINLHGCNTCHSIDGSTNIGPTWKGLYGNQRQFSDGSSAIADENYLRESIIYAKKKVVDGYTPSMPIYAGQLSDREIEALIAYIKALSE